MDKEGEVKRCDGGQNFKGEQHEEGSSRSQDTRLSYSKIKVAVFR